MLIPQPFYRTSRFWRWAMPTALFLLWLLFFYREIWLFLEFLLNGGTFPATGIPEADYRYAILVVVLSILAFSVYFYAAMWLVSQFVLPVRQPKERRQVFDRFMRYFSGAHGPAVFIREGKEVANPKELQSSLPGVAFVDLNSAIVLERQPFAVRSDEAAARAQRNRAVRQAMSGVRHAIEGTEIAQPSRQTLARAAGPGIVFTHGGERIRGVVNLRNHIKSTSEVLATTRDGFQVKGILVTIFSLGLPPDVVRIGFCAQPDEPDPFRPENLVGIQVSGNKITGTVEELDVQDQQEVYVFAMRARPGVGPVTPARNEQSHNFNPIYSFDPDRIFRAVYADARRVDTNETEKWQDLPIRVASEIFKTMLAAERYADLYKPDDPKAFPLWQTFRPRFGRTVRNQGALSYQFVRRKDGQPFTVGQGWDESDLDIFPVQPLRGSKVLRDRGIRLITASFPEIRPVNEDVRKTLLEFWRAKQQHQADLTRAPYDYERILAVTKARVYAQHKVIRALREILEDTSLPSEIVALRFLQAIQSLAKDPETERIMPQETIQMIDKFQSWFFPRPQ